MKAIVVIAVLAAAAIGFLAGRRASPVAAPLVPAAEKTSANNRTWELAAEVARLQAENEDLRKRVDAMVPLPSQPAVANQRPPLRISFNPRTDGLWPSTLEALGISEEEAQRGMPMLRAAAEEFRKLELEHMDEPVATGNVIVFRVTPYEEESNRVVAELLSQLSTVWNAEAVNRLRNAEPRRAFAALGAGYGDRVVSIQPSADGSYDVTERTTYAPRNHSTSGISMDAERLRRRFGIEPPKIEKR